MLHFLADFLLSLQFIFRPRANKQELKDMFLGYSGPTELRRNEEDLCRNGTCYHTTPFERWMLCLFP